MRGFPGICSVSALGCRLVAYAVGLVFAPNRQTRRTRGLADLLLIEALPMNIRILSQHDRRVRLIIVSVAASAMVACSHECRLQSDMPQNAAQVKALSDAQAKSADYCSSKRARCQYRIAQESDGSISIRANFQYDDAHGDCGGDLYKIWKYDAAGVLIPGK